MEYKVIRNEIEKWTKSAWLPLLEQDNHWKGTLVIMYLKKSVVRNKILIVIVLREVGEWKRSEPELINGQKRSLRISENNW